MLTERRRWILAGMLIGFWMANAGRAAAMTWYVATNGNDATHAGTNGWGDAYLTIGKAVGAAAGGDAVWVSNGTYNLAAQLTITNAITLLGIGGWSNTVVNGGGGTRCFGVSNANAVVDGFTISNGLATAVGTPENQGGGVFMTNGTVRNCWITHNQATGGYPNGAGVYISGGTVQDCLITWNTNAGTWARGGGVMMNGNGLVQRCVIRGNSTGTGAGGGVSLNGAGDTVRNCLIIGNYAPDTSELMGGGGVGMDAGTVQNCTIVGNRGIGLNRRSGGTVKNSIIYFNVDTAGNLHNWRNCTPSVATYCCTTPKLLPPGSGNTDGVPEFIDPGSSNGMTFVPGNYHLRFGSPLIDAGGTVAGLTDDLEKTPRPQASGGLTGGAAAYDIGAYEVMPTSGVFQCGVAPTATNGLDALTAVFTACVAGDPAVTTATWYGWDFGLGQTPQSGANKAVVTNTFGPGQYDVTLTVSNSLGAVTNYTRIACVQVVGHVALVATNGGSVYPYNTWANAATNIQAAVDAQELAYGWGVATAAVWVADGTYSNVLRIVVSQGLTVRSVNGRALTTIKRASGSPRGFYLNHASAVLDGFTISGFSPPNNGGAALEDDGPNGGGVLLLNGTVQNCTLRANSAADGAGIYANGGTVQYCTIESNVAGTAGAGYETASGGLVQYCVFRYNSEPNWGGGGVLLRGAATVRNSLFYGNVSSGVNGYGAVYADAGTVENCTIVGNQKGGLYMRFGGTVRNCVVYNNSYTNCYDQSGGRISSTCTTPLPSGGTSNIVSDPQFVDAGSGTGLTYVVGDLHLGGTSPCINAGTNQTWMTNALDYAGVPRIIGGLVDLGAYEWGAGAPSCSNNAPTNISLSGASLNGQLISTNGVPTSFAVYWGPSDGGTNAAAWTNSNSFGVVAQGAYSTNVTFTSSQMYYYRYHATSGGGDAWASTPAAFLAGEVSVVASDPNASAVGPDPGAFTISRPAAATNGALNVNWTVGGSAVSALDYTSIVSAVTLPAAVASTNITIFPIKNLLNQSNVTVVLTVTAGPYLIGAANCATVTIAPFIPATWYVRTDGSDANAGTNWTAAFQTISNAVTHASASETVLVSNGVYNITTQILIAADIALRGVGGSSNTVINGGGVTRGLYLASTGAVVDGFTISNGFASGSANPANNGGGVYLTGGTVQNCLITLNRSGGAGAYPDGAGVWMSGGTVQDCLITWNTNAGVWTRGGGVMMNGNGLVQRCILRGNSTGSGAGGGISVNGAGDVARNCLVIGNYAADTSELGGGGGIGMDGGTVENCTIAGNRGVGVNRRNGGLVRNAIAYFNVDTAGRLANNKGFSSASLMYSCTTPKPLPITSDDTDTDPGFVNAGSGNGVGLVPGDYHLAYGSLAIDAGMTLAAITNDLDRGPRPLNGRGAYGAGGAVYDMGAYEAVVYTAGTLQCTIAPTATNGLDALTAVLTAAVAGGATATNGLGYAWDFGDGHVLASDPSQRVVTNTYGPGQFNVTLTVTNSLGAVATYTRTGEVRVVARTTYVATNGASVYPYNAWTNAATNLQAAVDVAGVACDAGAGTNALVLVSNGTYAIDAQILMAKGVTLRSVNGRDATTVRQRSGSATRGFYIQAGGAVLDGFTISGFTPVSLGAGGSDEGIRPDGAAVLIPSTGSGGTVQNCTLSYNTNSAVNGYGAVYLFNGTLRNCIIERNATWTDLISLGNASVLNCIIRYNSNLDWGGAGVTFRAAGATVRNCLFYGNSSTLTANGWGTVFMDGGLLESCTLVANQNGGVYIRSSGAVVRNCIVYSNSYTNWYDGPGFSYSYTCTTPAPAGAPGNIAADPQFRSAGAGVGLGLVPGDYRLWVGSPCVNAGINQTWMTNAVDLAGAQRIFKGIVDLGAYENDSKPGSVISVR